MPTTSRISTLAGRVARLQKKHDAIENEVPAWCARGTQGAMMIYDELTRLGWQIGHATDPDWFVGDELPAQAAEEVERVGCMMVLSGSYRAAQAIVIREQDKWPPVDYKRWRKKESTTTENHSS
jgi:hypothetical protein